MGSVLKFYVSYDEPYWLRQGFSGQFLSNGGRKNVNTESGMVLEGGPITWLVDGTPHSKVPMLVGFLGGKLAVEWSQVTRTSRTLGRHTNKYSGIQIPGLVQFSND